ncbi:hypothetical protein SVTN_31285 [Streptomyces vietnamensis]|uniref:Uncharacterized protein n=1 Tax=Streptomyces vietnamensis TaxID=362257 RepID=A0A0B5IEQ5_9ACTN|nr:hypothetical protein SVTN_31285 [Streptomyces vietnamensis]
MAMAAVRVDAPRQPIQGVSTARKIMPSVGQGAGTPSGSVNMLPKWCITFGMPDHATRATA